MKVKDLVQKLATLDPNMQVLNYQGQVELQVGYWDKVNHEFLSEKELKEYLQDKKEDLESAIKMLQAGTVTCPKCHRGLERDKYHNEEAVKHYTKLMKTKKVLTVFIN